MAAGQGVEQQEQGEAPGARATRAGDISSVFPGGQVPAGPWGVAGLSGHAWRVALNSSVWLRNRHRIVAAA